MSTRFNYKELIESRHRLADAFKNPSIVRQSKHRLRGGDEATFYFDFDIATNDPQHCADIVQNMSGKIIEINLKRRIDYLAFIEKMGRATVGAIRVAGAISIAVGLPTFIIRLGKELPFERIKLYGNSDGPASKKLDGSNIVLVTDHMTSGAEVLQAINTVERGAGIVTDILCYTLKPKAAESSIEFLLSKKIVVHAINFMYDLQDGQYRQTQGGTIENASEIIKFES